MNHVFFSHFLLKRSMFQRCNLWNKILDPEFIFEIPRTLNAECIYICSDDCSLVIDNNEANQLLAMSRQTEL